MTNQHEQAIIEKLRTLPPDLIAEVEDFVDFLRSRSEARRLAQASMKVSEQSFARIWDNPDDAAYDRL